MIKAVRRRGTKVRTRHFFLVRHQSRSVVGNRGLLEIDTSHVSSHAKSRIEYTSRHEIHEIHFEAPKFDRLWRAARLGALPLVEAGHFVEAGHCRAAVA